jgi:hypothetical protein
MGHRVWTGRAMAKKKKSPTGRKPPAAKRSVQPILHAEPANFPGVRIPLVSEEERIALGLPEVRFPPKQTWTEEQRRALNKLGEIVIPIAIYEAVTLMAQVVPKEPETHDVVELERAAAKLALPLLMHKKWKNAWTAFHVPRSYVEVILTRIAEGQVSILAPHMAVASTRSRRRSPTKRKPPLAR